MTIILVTTYHETIGMQLIMAMKESHNLKWCYFQAVEKQIHNRSRYSFKIVLCVTENNDTYHWKVYTVNNACHAVDYEWTKSRVSAVFPPNSWWQVPIINLTESVGNNAPSYS